MISLKTALELTQPNNDLIYLRRKNQIFRSEYEALTIEEVKEKYDIKKIKVIEIFPYFVDGEYDGLLFTII